MILKFVDFQPHGKKVARNKNFINSASFPLLFVTIYFVLMVNKMSQPKVALKLSQNWYFPINLFFKLQPMRDGGSKRGEFVEFESEMDDGFLLNLSGLGHSVVLDFILKSVPFYLKYLKCRRLSKLIFRLSAYESSRRKMGKDSQRGFKKGGKWQLYWGL